MSKKEKIVDKYIRVDIGEYDDPEELCRQIERHVDFSDASLRRQSHTSIKEVTIDICEYCGHEWEVVEEKDACFEEPAGLPGCCVKAQDEFWASPEGIEAQKKFAEASGITPHPRGGECVAD